jgi:membrane fusion protein, heavy metal efflux system
VSALTVSAWFFQKLAGSKSTGSAFSALLLAVWASVLLLSTTVFAQQNEPVGPRGEPIPLSALGKAALGLQTRTATKVSLPLQIAVPGKIEAIPTREFDQHAPLSGRISKVEVSLGQFVKQGQVLVVVESPEMNQLAADLLQSKLSTESDYARQKTLMDDEVRQWEAKEELAEANYKRLQRLQEDRIAAQKDVVQALADLKVAETRVVTAKENRDIMLRALKTKIGLTELPIKQRLEMLGVDKAHVKEMLKSQTTLESVPVVSMRSGLVTALSASAGQSIDPSVTLFTVSDLSHVWATANVYEDDMSRIKLGEKVVIKVHALSNETVEGRVSFVGNQVDPATRTLPVRVELANPLLKLKPSMFAELYIQTSEPYPMIVLPNDAVVQKNGHTLVFTETAAGFQPVFVKLGRSVGDDVEILEGLQEGQKVVTRGAFQLGAELIKMHGGEALFKSPTEGEELHTEGGNAGALNLNVQTMLVVVAGAFLLGFIMSALFMMHGRSTRLTLKVEHTGSVEPTATEATEQPPAKTKETNV